MAQINHERELAGEKQISMPLNRLFLGNPGTGKTTTALLYGRILKGLGFLSDGSVSASLSRRLILNISALFIATSQNHSTPSHRTFPLSLFACTYVQGGVKTTGGLYRLACGRLSSEDGCTDRTMPRKGTCHRRGLYLEQQRLRQRGTRHPRFQGMDIKYAKIQRDGVYFLFSYLSER